MNTANFSHDPLRLAALLRRYAANPGRLSLEQAVQVLPGGAGGALEALQERPVERWVYLLEHPGVIRGVAGFRWIPNWMTIYPRLV